MNDRADRHVDHINNNQRRIQEHQLTFAEIELEQQGPEQAKSIVVSSDHQEREMDWQRDFRYVSRERQFVEQARVLEWENEAVAEFIPFHAYWPTYEQMQPRQLRWYLYWRGEVRSGRYPDTDLSYLFVYLYELIHGVGWSEPAEGYELMRRVWLAYRERYPELDGYVREWLYDYSLVFELEVPPAEPLQKLPRGLSRELKELEWKRRFTAEPLVLTWDMLRTMIDYDVEKSRFYTGQGRKDLQLYVPKVVSIVDAYLFKSEGARLLERFMPREKKVSRPLFRTAVYDHELYGRSISVSVLPISEHLPLRSFLTQLARFTENKLRELAGFRGKLRGITIEPAVEELVVRYLHRDLEQRKVEKARVHLSKVKINTVKLHRLQRESDEVRDMLMAEEQVEIDFERLQIEPVLRAGSMSAYSKRRDEEVSSEGGKQVEIAAEAAATGLSQEWRELFAQLSGAHRELLSVLLNGENTAARFRIAEQAGSMPELLLDEINEISMEWMGDLLVDGDEIVEEYRAELQSMLGGSGF
ncbi:TerB N-terminal domain-containing protein [Paenibacillus lentus]|uniref:TerB N-terminal domain-containing protein n=1 Tax=Paenibacillus lentus TaxID=1338368 RepID=A0A3Q8SD49_9BACL|nr:TerB N-terminal domain-containing protein [Paenibacillus lentus]AZK47917.1 hypothetical protein EIM92_18545 [Paenibacillus lentus]